MNLSEMHRNMHRAVAQAHAATTATVHLHSGGTFGNDLSITGAVDTSMQFACTHPRSYSADDIDGQNILQGDAFVLVDRQDAGLTSDLQPGQRLTVESEQYRIHKLDYLSGAIRVHLRGGAAEGAAGS